MLRRLAALFLMMLLPSSAWSQGSLTGAFAAALAPNEGATGTTVNLLATLNTSGQAIKATTGSTTVPVYIVTAGAGTTGNAALSMGGPALCVMDGNASNTGGFFVVASTTTAGRCHAQSATPNSVYLVGYLLSSSTTAGSTSIVLVGGPQPGSVLNTGNVLNTVTKTFADSGYTATTADYTILVNAAGGATSIVIPAASTMTGRIFNIKKIDSSFNAVTVDRTGADTFDGATSIGMSLQYQSVTIQSDGSLWYIL